MEAMTDTDTDTDRLTPEHLATIHQTYRNDHIDVDDDHGGMLDAYLTPTSRAKILRAFAGWPDETLTAADVADLADVGTSTVDRQLYHLLHLEVVQEAGMVGNAMTYQLNPAHPVAQIFRMADNLAQFEVTPQLLDPDFVGKPAVDE